MVLAAAAVQVVRVEVSQAEHVAQAAHRQLAIGQAQPTTTQAAAVVVELRLVVLAQQVVRQVRQEQAQVQPLPHQPTQAVAVAAGKVAVITLLRTATVAQAVRVRLNFAT